MPKENLSELSTEDLIKKKKAATLVTGLLAAALIALLIITISQTITKGFTALTIIPFSLLPILIICISQVAAMSKELKIRKQN